MLLFSRSYQRNISKQLQYKSDCDNAMREVQRSTSWYEEKDEWIHLFCKELVSDKYASGTVLGAGNMAAKQTGKIPARIKPTV